MKVIQLTKGAACIVDDEDFSELAQWRWYLGNHGYAERSMPMVNGKRGKNQLMHREIMGNPLIKVDHINGNRLDNRRCNLRLVSDSENAINSSRQSNNKSGLKGVWFSKSKGRYTAQISRNGERKHLGYFDTPEKAHAAYCDAAVALHGEFARLN